MRVASRAFFVAMTAVSACAGRPAPQPAAEEPWNYERHVAKRTAEIEAAGREEGGVLFVGDSITDAGGDWSRWFPGVRTSNQGIGGDRTDAVLARMDTITRGTPQRVFLMIGTNDLSGGATPEAAADDALAVASAIADGIAGAEIYVQSVLPREAAMAQAVEALNARLAAKARAARFVYLDLHASFAAADGSLRADLTEDDLHLNGEGYALWADLIDRCVRVGCEGL